MADNNITIKNSGGFGRIGLLLILVSFFLIVTVAAYMLFFISDPKVTGTDGFKILSADNTISFKGENLKSLEVSIYQEGKITELLKDSPSVKNKLYTLRLKPADHQLTDGQAVIIIKAKAGIFKKVRYEFKTIIDTIPPALEALRSPPIINKGSVGIAVLRVTDADSVYIRLEDKTFPAFETGLMEDLQTEPVPGYGVEPYDAEKHSNNKIAKKYYVFFPAPFDTDESSIFYAIAQDAAGNRSIRALSTKIKAKEYKTSSIQIGDTFINSVVGPLLNDLNITDPEGAFKKVNEDWREQSLKKIIEIAKNTKKEILWDGRFLQLRNSKVMATYGDERTYIYNDKEISKAVHLGYDLASFSHAPVGAANSGVVVLAEDLSIYGNTVIIDHGMGLMSLYGHLSTIMVSDGQTINKGQTIGKTGATGLAGGDHLHFGILIHGYEVSPLYWWDINWIRIHIMDYLT